MSPSCDSLSPTACNGESCCTSIAVPSGTFLRGRGTAPSSNDNYSDGSDYELPEHEAAVDGFALDKYEVTVGRFRAFIADYNRWHGGTPSSPQPGDGVHPTTAGTGWLADFSNSLPANYVTLLGSMASCGDSTWTNSAGDYEASAINCIGWAEAFAFCIWDGGRLPTEAEWEYAAAGATENRLFSWGQAEPNEENVNSWATTRAPSRAVGDKTPGYFGHQDLSGSMWEWVFDWYSSSFYGTSSAPAACSNCVNTTRPTSDPNCTACRVARGGAWDTTENNIRAARRGYFYPNGSRGGGIGFRCARRGPVSN
jgi:formylglycine-generating enzyme required for sulfatase activity